MPNRFIKESICSSENIDQLTEFQEVFFYRLVVNCDDFGRFDAREKLLSSRLFPLRDVSVEKVRETLDALERADLITVYQVKGHPYLQVKTWEKHQQRRATESRYPDPENADDVIVCDENKTDDNECNQMLSNDINGYQEQSDDSKCPRIRIRNTYSYNDNRNRQPRAEDDDDEQMISDQEASEIRNDHDRILDAAEDAGFTMSNDVRAALIALYAQHGLVKVLDGLKSCVEHGAPKLAYLRACLTDKPKKAPGKAVIAQQYEQRDYGSEQDDAMKRMLAMGGYSSA